MSSDAKSETVQKTQKLTETQAHRLGVAHAAVQNAQAALDHVTQVRSDLVAMLLDAAGLPADASISLENGVVFWEEPKADKKEEK